MNDLGKSIQAKIQLKIILISLSQIVHELTYKEKKNCCSTKGKAKYDNYMDEKIIKNSTNNLWFIKK